MRFSTLEQWLHWQETLHPSEIELGLERVRRVMHGLQDRPPGFRIITVGGTNGKGSTVAMLEAIYLAAGYRVGCYTSPHLLQYNERIRINGEAIGDDELIAAFERVDQARGEVSLTYFEFGTLAAIDLFYRQPLDLVILEVGMGGRLDAVNILDPDVALVTNVDLDHMAWLGSDREAIGHEKAGIYRPGRTAIFNDTSVPQSLRRHAESIGARLLLLGRDYEFHEQGGQWRFQAGGGNAVVLPPPALPGAFQIHNAAAVLMAVESLRQELPLGPGQIRQGLLSARLPGRVQIRHRICEEILDVAHNPHAAAELARTLGRRPVPGRCYAVVGMLADKDIRAVLGELCGQVDEWLLAGLDLPRGSTAMGLASALGEACEGAQFSVHANVTDAYAAALETVREQDRILVFGSFYTVAEVLTEHV